MIPTLHFSFACRRHIHPYTQHYTQLTKEKNVLCRYIQTYEHTFLDTDTQGVVAMSFGFFL